MIVDNDAIKEVIDVVDGNYITKTITKTIITKEAFVEAYNKWIAKDWLSTFNTDSATECYTAIQRLKAEVEG